MGTARKVRGIVPRRVRLTVYPLDSILKLAIVSAGGQYLVYVPFLLSVYYDRRPWFL
jgi:hypothetical protein